MITFVSGGARSGKSSFAEQLAIQWYQKESRQINENAHLYYLATAQAFDLEMKDRIKRHINERIAFWETIEEPYYIASCLKRCGKGDMILLDCLTIWLSNMMFGLSADSTNIRREIEEWTHLVREKECHLLIVSNDVNEGAPPPTGMVQSYIRVLGELHQQVVAETDLAVQVVAGIPVIWKGKLE